MKGGVGKTTLAVHLAVAAIRAGESVAIIDTDPQASAAAWARIRNGGSPDVVPVPVQRLAQALAAAADDYSVVIVERPRAHRQKLRPFVAPLILRSSRRPSAVDLETLAQSVSIVQAGRRDGLIVLNACPTRAPEIAEARGYAESLGLPVAAVAIGERRPFARAFAEGAGIAERERGPATDEVAALWAEISVRLGVTPPNETTDDGFSVSKPTKLLAFARTSGRGAVQPEPDPVAEAASAAPATIGSHPTAEHSTPLPTETKKKERVATNLRLTDQWRRVHELALEEETTVQQLAIRGLSRLAKQLESICFSEGTDYIVIGVDEPGKKNIEGYVPVSITSRVYADNADLV